MEASGRRNAKHCGQRGRGRNALDGNQPDGNSVMVAPRGPELADNAQCFSARDVTVSLQDSSGNSKEILAGLNFDIAPGEFVSLVGPSGCGKTTLLRLLAGLGPGFSGKLRLREQTIDGPSRDAIIVFQDYVNALLPWRRVAHNVALPLERKVPRHERTARVENVLRTVGLLDKKDDFPGQLSGGMQQRLQIARALVVEPSVLLMDEPFGALDSMTKSILQDELLAEVERTSATVVFVTHDIDEAVYLSDRIIVLGGSPSGIAHEVAVELPRPRNQLETRESPEFLHARHTVLQMIAELPSRSGESS